MRELKLFLYPPVDPITGEKSAESNRVLLDRMRHCDAPGKWMRVDCTALMCEHSVDLSAQEAEPALVCPEDQGSGRGPKSWTELFEQLVSTSVNGGAQ